MVSDDPAGFMTGVVPYHWTQVVNIKRDPFETSVGQQIKTLIGMGGAIAAPATAYVYDWNILPIGQALWLKELESYVDFPPMQDPASYNLEQVIQQVKTGARPVTPATKGLRRMTSAAGGRFARPPARLLTLMRTNVRSDVMHRAMDETASAGAAALLALAPAAPVSWRKAQAAEAEHPRHLGR